MKLKVGDRIRVYGFDSDDAGISFTRHVDELRDDGLIKTDAGEFVHPKQCRRLVKKKHTEWTGSWVEARYVESEARVFIPDDYSGPIGGTRMKIREVKPSAKGG